MADYEPLTPKEERQVREDVEDDGPEDPAAAMVGRLLATIDAARSGPKSPLVLLPVTVEGVSVLIRACDALYRVSDDAARASTFGSPVHEAAVKERAASSSLQNRLEYVASVQQEFFPPDGYVSPWDA